MQQTFLRGSCIFEESEFYGGVLHKREIESEIRAVPFGLSQFFCGTSVWYTVAVSVI